MKLVEVMMVIILGSVFRTKSQLTSNVVQCGHLTGVSM